MSDPGANDPGPNDRPPLWALPYDDRATKDDILACFRLLLGRNPNEEEWSGHSARAGETLGAVVSTYLNSLEFSRRRLQDSDRPPPAVAEKPGFRILASPDDLDVGREVLHGDYEPHVAAVFRDVLRPGMHVVDVGANIGYFTMLTAALVGPAGSVLAVEPNAANARMLEASRRLNGFAHVTVLQAAAGRTTGLLAINTAFTNGTTSAIEDGQELAATSVACLALDRMVDPSRRIGLVKLDVEGAEHNALLGCQALLRRDRPVLVFEFGPGQMPAISGVTGAQMLQWLVDEGYGFEVIRHDGPPAPMGQDVAAVMRAHAESGVDHIDVLARPRSVGAVGAVLRSLGERLRRSGRRG